MGEAKPHVSQCVPVQRLCGFDHYQVNAGLTPWRLWQLGLGAFVCVLLPAWSWFDGSGSLAWSMYAHSASFRLRIAAFDERGKQRSLAPSALAAHAEQDLRTTLGGAEAFRHARQGRLLRRFLPELAKLACDVSQAERVTLTLEEKPDLDTPARVDVERRHCDRARGVP